MSTAASAAPVTISYICLLCLLVLFLSPVTAEAIRSAPSSLRYTTMDPKPNDVYYGSPVVVNCLPKGFRRTSAPSHYANYQALGSNKCDDCIQEPCKP
ncbi:hypothetical protein ACHQM5_020601 [Ranunculus cassubicifolius]